MTKKTALLALLLSLASQADAAYRSCVVSRNGNEFWLHLEPRLSATCETTVRLLRVESKGRPMDIEFAFSVQKNSQSSLVLTIDGKPMTLHIFDRLIMSFSGLTKEDILFDCTQAHSAPRMDMTDCHGARSYPSERRGGPVPDINGLVEILPP